MTAWILVQDVCCLFFEKFTHASLPPSYTHTHTHTHALLRMSIFSPLIQFFLPTHCTCSDVCLHTRGIASAKLAHPLQFVFDTHLKSREEPAWGIENRFLTSGQNLATQILPFEMEGINRNSILPSAPVFGTHVN